MIFNNFCTMKKKETKNKENSSTQTKRIENVSTQQNSLIEQNDTTHGCFLNKLLDRNMVKKV